MLPLPGCWDNQAHERLPARTKIGIDGQGGLMLKRSLQLCFKRDFLLLLFTTEKPKFANSCSRPRQILITISGVISIFLNKEAFPVGAAAPRRDFFDAPLGRLGLSKDLIELLRNAHERCAHREL